MDNPVLPQNQINEPAGNTAGDKENILSYSQSSSAENDSGSKKHSKVKKIIFFGIFAFVALTVIFFIIFLFSRSPQTPNEETGGEIIYWGTWEEEGVANFIISEFEKENPNIKVKYEKQDPLDYREKLLARIEAGRGPDVFRFHNSWYQDLSDVLLAIPSEVISRKDFESNFYDVHQKDLIKNGAIIGIPTEVDTLALYINPQLVASVEAQLNTKITLPVTWQEFIESSASLTQKDEQGRILTGGAGIGTYNNVNNAPDIISLLFVQNRADLNNLQKTDVRVSDALRFYTNFTLVGNNVWEDNTDSTLLSFSQGNLAMYFGFARDYAAIRKLNPSLNFNVISIPQLRQDEKFNIANYYAEGISARSNKQGEAFKFLAFLAKAQTQEKIWAQASKNIQIAIPPANKGLLEKLKDTKSFVFAQQALTAYSSPYASTEIENSKNEGINIKLRDAVNAILAGTSPESGAEILFGGASEADDNLPTDEGFDFVQ